MEANLPIDIHIGKLVDWLISRRHCKKSWTQAIQVVREKVNSAIQDMPEHPDVTKLLAGAYINYFHCTQIIEILRETEKESKNIFGWYTSKRMKDWQEIVKLYEVDNLYLIEAAQFLGRSVVYELPSLKRQVAKCRAIQEECDRKEEECIKNALVAKEKFYSSCKQIGIAGENVRSELLSLVAELPQKFKKIASKTKTLEDPIKFYTEFAEFVSASKKDSLLPLLRYIIDNGDVTVYEWKHGETPIIIKKQVHYNLFMDPKDREDNGFVVVDSPESNSSDCVIPGDANPPEENIDWGTPITPSAVDSNECQIDWDVGEMESFEGSQIELESSGMEGGVAEGEEALTVLSNEVMRNQFINELLELETFITQRRVELSAEDSVLSMSQFSSAPKSIQYQNKDTLDGYLDNLRSIIEDISNSKMQDLYLIDRSSRYVDRLADSLKSKLRESERLTSKVAKVTRRRSDAILEEQQLTSQMSLIIARTKELQKDVEVNISHKYKMRPVNLMGGIQNI